MPVFTASCEMVICGICGVNAWMTRSPRASEVMKLGSPAKPSRVDAGVDLEGIADATAAEASAVRADARPAERSLLAAAVPSEREAAAGRRDAMLIEVPSRSPAIGLPCVPWPNLNPGVNWLNIQKCDSRIVHTINAQRPHCKIAAERLEEHRIIQA
jgi:hypothetical protein